MKFGASDFFAKHFERLSFAKGTTNYGKAYHKALKYANG